MRVLFAMGLFVSLMSTSALAIEYTCGAQDQTNPDDITDLGSFVIDSEFDGGNYIDLDSEHVAWCQGDPAEDANYVVCAFVNISGDEAANGVNLKETTPLAIGGSDDGARTILAAATINSKYYLAYCVR